MAKSYYDPEYGEMIGIAEVEKITGITKAQLRNWRKPEHHHLAKFDYFAGEANQIWYRKDDVEHYLSTHGVKLGQSGLKRVEMPNSVKAPVVIPELDENKRSVLESLTKVTTQNVWLRYYNELAERHGQSFFTFIKPEQARLYGLWKGIDVTDVKFLPHNRRDENLELFYAGSVFAIRKFIASMSEGIVSITDQEIIQIPIGIVPPEKETK
jgi:hypothetical protein